MRMILHSLIAGALVALAWTTSLTAYAYDLTCRVGSCIRETLIWTFDGHLPRLVKQARPQRLITMASTALNDRLVGGVRVRGFLGRPAVQALSG